MKKLNFAILGCGRVSEYHARIIEKNKFTKLFAVCDKKISKAKKLGNKFNVNLSIKQYSNNFNKLSAKIKQGKTIHFCLEVMP